MIIKNKHFATKWK